MAVNLSIRARLWLLVLLVPALAWGEPTPEPARWSMEIKAGRFYPDIDDWAHYFGSDHTGHFAASLNYHMGWLELGVEGGYSRDRGRGLAPIHDFTAGSVKYEVFPLHAYLVVPLLHSESAWLVPYVGGGWSRLHYRQQLDGGDRVRGAASGHHLRAGVRLLLDRFDPRGARELRETFGIRGTLLVLEAQESQATVGPENVDLGGRSYLLGLQFRF